ncbi:MAG TPA: DUF3592 domain-containing protein [Pseudonocardiaceae bacterium]|nr:DUF3592 domain-containing protein [Pseudonocardiaceae bacterium]
MTGVGERIGADGVARRFLRRRLIVDVVLLAVGALLLATGIAGFTYLARQSNHLAATGVLATATAVEVDNYHYRFQQDEHIVVTFRVRGVVAVARCYIGASDQFVVGQSVPIVYDPLDPSHAQLAGTPDLGPIGAPFLAALVLGVLVAAPGGYRLFTRRGVGAALRELGKDMTATRFRRWHLSLRDRDEQLELRVRGQARRLAADTHVLVCGKDRVVVIIDPATNAVAYGRRPQAK